MATTQKYLQDPPSMNF